MCLHDSHPGRDERRRTAEGADAGARSGPAAHRALDRSVTDPFAELKTRVHKDIIARLGPRLFNADDQRGSRPSAVNERSPRCWRSRRRRSPGRSARTSSARSPTTSSATGRWSRSCATTPSRRSWSTTTTAIYIERHGKIDAHERAVRRRRAPAAHHRQDRLADRPPHRRVVADGRRPPARTARV